MRILILSCNTGEGHNSCAKALKEVFDIRGHYCIIEDALAFVSRSATKVISKGHTTIYRHFPGVFRRGYLYAENHPNAYRERSAIYNYFCSGKQRLADYIDSRDFDVVICTHTFAGIMLTETKKICSKDFYSAFVVTDYTCSPTFEISCLDVYFIPDSTLKKDFADNGIPESKLISSGIPIRQMFFTDMEKSHAKKAEGIGITSKHLLVMSGSMGCGPIRQIVSLISKVLSENEEMTVICGTNKRMQKALGKRYRNISNVHIRGYVSNISRLMDSADLYLTKPGGISVTEAKRKRLPMVFADAVAGCEEYNLRFFIEKGCAVSDKNIVLLTQKCISLLRDEKKRSTLSEKLGELDNKNSAQYICDYISDRVLLRG